MQLNSTHCYRDIRTRRQSWDTIYPILDDLVRPDGSHWRCMQYLLGWWSCASWWCTLALHEISSRSMVLYVLMFHTGTACNNIVLRRQLFYWLDSHRVGIHSGTRLLDQEAL
jgi:hypothetical protein